VESGKLKCRANVLASTSITKIEKRDSSLLRYERKSENKVPYFIATK
jgi:hypothetical protein